MKDKTDILLTEQPSSKVKKVKAKEKVKTVGARAKFLRISPRKLKLVIDLVRGLNVDQALDQLSFLNKKAARLVKTLLKSAMANAEHNLKLKKEDLFIAKIVANQGATFHRFQPAAFGRARPIRKRTAHLEIVLAVREISKIKEKSAKLLNKKMFAKAVKDKAKIKQPLPKKEEII